MGSAPSVRATLALFAALVASTSAQGASGVFSGVIDFSTDPLLLGQTFSGAFEFDPLDQSTGCGLTGAETALIWFCDTSYDHPEIEWGAVFSVGAQDFALASSDPGAFAEVSTFAGRCYNGGDLSSPDCGGFDGDGFAFRIWIDALDFSSQLYFDINVYDPMPTVLDAPQDGFAYIPDHVDLADWQGGRVSIGHYDYTTMTTTFYMRATLTSLLVVPEPGTATLVAMGLAMVVSRARSWRR